MANLHGLPETKESIASELLGTSTMLGNNSPQAESNNNVNSDTAHTINEENLTEIEINENPNIQPFFNKQGLNIFHLLYRKFDQIKLLLHYHKEIYLLCLCENFLDSHFEDSEFQVNSYTIF
jgi:hypothetical protein